VLLERFEEARRWFLQALRDLKAARDSCAAQNFEWTCFQAQQAAEKAAKALCFASGISPWGHSVVELLQHLKEKFTVSEELMTWARELDRHHIPSRYPNAFESGYPALFYDCEVASRALSCSQKIMEFTRGELKRLGVEI